MKLGKWKEISSQMFPVKSGSDPIFVGGGGGAHRETCEILVVEGLDRVHSDSSQT